MVVIEGVKCEFQFNIRKQNKNIILKKKVEGRALSLHLPLSYMVLFVFET